MNGTGQVFDGYKQMKNIKMKRLHLSIWIILLSTVMAVAQEGTIFRQLSVKDGLLAAEKEGKYLFVDCYTSWCGPCKNMTNNIFPQQKMGDYMNPLFVSVKFDVEKEEDGISLAKEFEVKAYPTFLVLRPDGSLVYKIVGGASEADAFLKKVYEVFDDEKALGSLQKMQENGDSNKQLLGSIVDNFTSISDEKTREVLAELLSQSSFPERTSPDFWFMYSTLRLSPKESANEEFLFEHYELLRETVGREQVDKQLGMRFHDRLKDVAEGRKKDLSPERLARLLEQAERANLDPIYNVMTYVKLSEALVNGDTDAIIKVMDEVAPRVGLWTYAIMYDNESMKGISEPQKEAWVAIAERVRPTLPNDHLQMLDGVLKGIETRREKRLQESK